MQSKTSFLPSCLPSLQLEYNAQFYILHFASFNNQLLLTSALEPRLCANGSVTNDGTKNTGNHFAKTSLPGDNKS